jgi:hypothetical protein
MLGRATTEEEIQHAVELIVNAYTTLRQQQKERVQLSPPRSTTSLKKATAAAVGIDFVATNNVSDKTTNDHLKLSNTPNVSLKIDTVVSANNSNNISDNMSPKDTIGPTQTIAKNNPSSPKPNISAKTDTISEVKSYLKQSQTSPQLVRTPTLSFALPRASPTPPSTSSHSPLQHSQSTLIKPEENATSYRKSIDILVTHTLTTLNKLAKK